MPDSLQYLVPTAMAMASSSWRWFGLPILKMLQRCLQSYFVGRPSWSDLPIDLLLVVFQKIQDRPGTLSCCARVCISWNLAIQTLDPLPISPFSVFRGPYKLGDRETFRLFNIDNCNGYQLILPELRGNWLSCCCNGWLLTISIKSPQLIQLLHPITGARIRLPPIKSGVNFQNKIRIAMSASPYNPKCVLLASHPYVEEELCFWKPGNRNWTRIDYLDQGVRVEDAIFYNGEFYITALCTLHYPQTNLIYRIRITPNKDSDPILEKLTHVIVEPADPKFKFTHFVEMMGELLLVLRYTHKVSCSKLEGNMVLPYVFHITKYVKVYKLELKEKRLVEVKELENYAIYLSNFHSTAKQVRKPCHGGNRVWYVDDYSIPDSDRGYGYRRSFYDLKTRITKTTFVSIC